MLSYLTLQLINTLLQIFVLLLQTFVSLFFSLSINLRVNLLFLASCILRNLKHIRFWVYFFTFLFLYHILWNFILLMLFCVSLINKFLINWSFLFLFKRFMQIIFIFKFIITVLKKSLQARTIMNMNIIETFLPLKILFITYLVFFLHYKMYSFRNYSKIIIK